VVTVRSILRLVREQGWGSAALEIDERGQRVAPRGDG
jgi:hypothetical protein